MAVVGFSAAAIFISKELKMGAKIEDWERIRAEQFCNANERDAMAIAEVIIARGKCDAYNELKAQLATVGAKRGRPKKKGQQND